MKTREFYGNKIGELKVRILVTGGAGFLGSHLSERLLAQGHEVFCLDNFMTGDASNVEHLLNQSNFHMIEHDVTAPFDLEVEGIFNLACPASPIWYQQDPVNTTKVSVLGAINMLDLAHRNNARILQASTSEVYGDPKVSPQSEEYWGHVNPIGIRSCYDEGKRAAESLFMDYRRKYQVDIRIARIFNTYGPRMSPNDGRVVSNFICQALENEPITIYGDGSQVRSFCYVDDLIEGLIKLFFAEDINVPVNIGNPEPFTIYQLAEKIIRDTNSGSQIVHRELPEDDPITREPDIRRAQDLLSWTPNIPLEIGLANTIEYFREKIKSPIVGA